jgi:flavin reductase (DIM6/NTAB) family NADH-FMN oxidoreductase RutF
MKEAEFDDAAAYRRGLGGFATGVVLVTAEGPAGSAGIVVNSFTSVSLSPRLVAWCLGDASDRFAVFAAAELWAINVLSADQQDIASRFARPGGSAAADVAVETLGGCPVLPGAVAQLVCRTYDRRAVGDHMMIIGEVSAFRATPGDGLTYFRGRYGRATVEA